MTKTQPQYDVLIPVAKKDASFVKNVVTYINRNLIGCEKIYIVTNQENFKRLNALTSREANVVLLDENALVPELSFGIRGDKGEVTIIELPCAEFNNYSICA